MRRFLLGVAKWSTVGVTLFSAVSGISGIVLGVLPTDATSGILDYLGQTAQNIQTAGYVAFGGSIVGALGLAGVKTINLKLKDSDLSRQAWQAETETKIARKFQLQEQVIDLTVQKQNVIISQNETIIKNQNAILAFNAIQAQRNILSSLVPQKIKDLYSNELENLSQMNFDIIPITKIITEVKEVIVETEKTESDRL